MCLCGSAETIIARDEPARFGSLGIGEMQAIENAKTKRVQFASPLRNGGGVRNGEPGTLQPHRCGKATVLAWIGVILDRQGRGAHDDRTAVFCLFENPSHRLCLATDPFLPLVVERSLQAAQVQIDSIQAPAA